MTVASNGIEGTKTVSAKTLYQSAAYDPERVKHRLVAWSEECDRRPWRVTELGSTMATLREYRTAGDEIPVHVQDAARRSDAGVYW